MIVGQKSLLSKLNMYDVDTFPHSSIFIGEKGMGKHTIVNYIQSSILNFPIVDITELISYELIDNIYRNTSINIYLVNISEISEKDQNAILKFVEEPLANSFVILLAENAASVLPTIINRCMVFELQPYSQEELSSFFTTETDRDLLLSILRTPGKILNTNLKNIRDILDVCDKIATKLQQASFVNTLSIAKKINFKDEYDKFDFDIFLDCLAFSLSSRYIISNDNKLFTLYNILREQREKLSDKRLNKQIFFNHLLTELWLEARKG